MLKNKSLLITLIIVLVLNLTLAAAVYFVYYSIGVKEKEILGTRSEIASYEKRIKNVQQLEKILGDTKEQRLKLEEIFIGENELIDFITELERISKIAGVSLKVSGIQMPKEKEKPMFVTETEGSFADIYHYLKLLENNSFRVSFKRNDIGRSKDNYMWKMRSDFSLLSFKNEN